MPFTPYPHPATVGQTHEPFGAGNGTFVNEGERKWAPQAQGGGGGITAEQEVVLSSGALSGAAPAGAEFGVDITNDAFYKVVGGNWQPMSIGGADFGDPSLRHIVGGINQFTVPGDNSQTWAIVDISSTGTGFEIGHTGVAGQQGIAIQGGLTSSLGTINGLQANRNLAYSDKLATPTIQNRLVGTLAGGDYIISNSGGTISVNLVRIG